MVPGESSGDFDAVHAREPDVHQDHVGAKPVDHFQSGLAGVGVADNVQVGVSLENLTGAIPVQGVVVDDHHAYDRGVQADQARRGPGQPRRKSPTHPWVERTVTDGSDRGAARERTRQQFDWNTRAQRRATVSGWARPADPSEKE